MLCNHNKNKQILTLQRTKHLGLSFIGITRLDQKIFYKDHFKIVKQLNFYKTLRQNF